jgi:predicted nucleic acid-binding protein
MEVMLDTNAYSDWLRDGRWDKRIATADRVSIPTTVIGELYHGFHGGNRFEENVSRLKEFLNEPVVEVVPVDIEIAELYGEMVCGLGKKGIKLPTNDIWIGAAAVVRGAVLLTSNSDFDHWPQVRRGVE